MVYIAVAYSHYIHNKITCSSFACFAQYLAAQIWIRFLNFCNFFFSTLQYLLQQYFNYLILHQPSKFSLFQKLLYWIHLFEIFSKGKIKLLQVTVKKKPFMLHEASTSGLTYMLLFMIISLIDLILIKIWPTFSVMTTAKTSHLHIQLLIKFIQRSDASNQLLS